jgi:hypothetical protein
MIANHVHTCSLTDRCRRARHIPFRRRRGVHGRSRVRPSAPRPWLRSLRRRFRHRPLRPGRVLSPHGNGVSDSRFSRQRCRCRRGIRPAGRRTRFVAPHVGTVQRKGPFK